MIRPAKVAAVGWPKPVFARRGGAFTRSYIHSGPNQGRIATSITRSTFHRAVSAAIQCRKPSIALSGFERGRDVKRRS